jgi:hypothetical protein
MRLLRTLTSTLVALVILSSQSFAQVRLEEKLTPGETVKSRETNKVTQNLKIADQSIDTKAETTMETRQSIKESGGLLKMTFAIDSVKSRVELPGNQVLEFDSSKPAPADDSDALTKSVRELFNSLIGASVEATLSGRKVIVVDGLTEKMPINADEMKAEFQQRIDQMPDQPVKPGDTWERTVELHIGAGQTLTFQRKYEYIGTVHSNPADPGSKEVDEIKGTDLSVLYTVRPNPQLPITVKKSDLKIDRSEHTLAFDRTLGRVVKSNGKSHIVGNILLAIGGQELDGALDLQLESTSQEIK